MAPILLKDGIKIMNDGMDKLCRILEGGHCETLISIDDFKLLYNTCYNMCTQKHPSDYSRQLYYLYNETLTAFGDLKALRLKRKEGEEFLGEFCQWWTSHNIMLRWLLGIFRPVEKHCISLLHDESLHGIPSQPASLQDVGLSSLESVYEANKVQARKAVILLIKQGHEGQHIDQALIKNVVAVFVGMGRGSLDYYVNDLEKELLIDAADYYTPKAYNWFQQGDTFQTSMIKTTEYLETEKDRFSQYLHPSTGEKLIKQVLEQLLIEEHDQLVIMLRSNYLVFVKLNQTDNLKMVYILFVPKFWKLLTDLLREHVIAEGMPLLDLVNNEAESKIVFMQKVVELYRKYKLLVTACFQNNHLFSKAIKKAALQVFLNVDSAGQSDAELMSSFVDYYFKEGGDDIEATLSTVSEILEAFEVGEHFMESHQKRLSMRLLSGNPAKYASERSFLSKLRVHHSNVITRDMEVMVKDIESVKDNKLVQIQNTIANGMDFKIALLHSSCWPNYRSFDINLPEEMSKQFEVVEKFYKERNKDRKLRLQHGLSRCLVVVKNNQGRKIDIAVNAAQAALLMLFNTSEELTYTEIVGRLNLADGDAIDLLHSLSCGMYKILIKQPDTITISWNDSFMYNAEFTCNERMIKVPQPRTVPDKDQMMKAIMQAVRNRRESVIDSTILRIMKNRKTLPIRQLFSECHVELKGQLKVEDEMIGKRLTKLTIEKHLEVCKPKDPLTLRYIPD